MDVAKAEEAVVSAQTAVDEARAMLKDAEGELSAAQKERDQAVAERDGPVHPHQDQIDRMNYIQSQAAQRAARAGKSAALVEKLGGDVESLDSRSPIDAAMGRKTKRGTQRPQREG